MLTKISIIKIYIFALMSMAKREQADEEMFILFLTS